jgi:hypothetical protein
MSSASDFLERAQEARGLLDCDHEVGDVSPDLLPLGVDLVLSLQLVQLVDEIADAGEGGRPVLVELGRGVNEVVGVAPAGKTLRVDE